MFVSMGRKRIEFIFDEVARKLIPNKKDIGSLKAIVDRFELQGKSILEIGCGIGDNLIYCSHKGIKYAEEHIQRKAGKTGAAAV